MLSIALRRVVFFEMRINLLAEIKDVKAELRKLEEGPPLPTARKEPATKKCAKKKQQEDDAPTTPEEIQERIGMLEEDLVEMEQELQQVQFSPYGCIHGKQRTVIPLARCQLNKPPAHNYVHILAYNKNELLCLVQSSVLSCSALSCLACHLAV